MSVELRHYRYFAALAEELHFGRAAARVNITQPPFSKQIRELEDQLQVRLFNRDRKTVKLTQAGRVFLPYVARVFDLLEDGARAARRAQRGQLGKLAIGYTSTAAIKLLPAVLRGFRKNHLEVELALHEMVPPEQLDALEKRRIDVGFMRPEAAVSRFDSKVFLREPLVLAVPTDHPLSHRKSVDLRSLKSEGFIMPPPRDGGLYRETVGLLQRAALQPRAIQMATQLRSIIGLVSAGIGISIVPASASRMNIASVKYIPLRGIVSHTELVMVWRKGDDSSVLGQFLEAANQVARSAERV